MKAPETKPEINSNIDGNAFVILEAVITALRQGEADQEYIDKYTKEARSGDYNHLLATTMKYVEFT